MVHKGPVVLCDVDVGTCSLTLCHVPELFVVIIQCIYVVQLLSLLHILCIPFP